MIRGVADEANLIKSEGLPKDFKGIHIDENTPYSIVQMKVLGNTPSDFLDNPPDLIEGFEEAVQIAGDDGVYECTPYDIGEEDVEYMQVPYFSQTVGSQVSMNMLQGLVYMFYLAIIVLICVFVLPNTYSSLVNYTTLSEEQKQKVVFFEWMIPLSFIFAASVLIMDGLYYHGSPSEINAGFFIAFLFTCILFTIQLIKGFTKGLNGEMTVNFWSWATPSVFYAVTTDKLFWIPFLLFYFLFFWVIVGGFLSYYMYEGQYPFMIFLYGLFFSFGGASIMYTIMNKAIGT